VGRTRVHEVSGPFEADRASTLGIAITTSGQLATVSGLTSETWGALKADDGASGLPDRLRRWLALCA